THLAREGRMTVTIGRRELLVALGGAAAAWPLAARAQQPALMRRIGVLMGSADDPAGQARVTALKEGFPELGWIECVTSKLSHGLVEATSAAYGFMQQN